MNTAQSLHRDDDDSVEIRIPAPSELYADWMARRELGRGRQATLSRNLNTLVSYRSWADKVRGTWDVDTATTPRKK
jgi:hypothetical protein